MADLIKQFEKVLCVQRSGKGTPYAPLGLGRVGMDNTTIQGPQKNAVYGSGQFGQPIPIAIQRTPPGDLPTSTLQFYDTKAQNFVMERLAKDQSFSMQVRTISCNGSRDNPNLWDVVENYSDLDVQQGQIGQVGLAWSGENIQNSAGIKANFYVKYVRPELVDIPQTLSEDITGIAGVSDPLCTDTGYQGADQIYIVTLLPVAAAKPQVWATQNNFQSMIQLTDPGVADDTFAHPIAAIVSPTQVRFAIGKTLADAGNPASIFYTTLPFRDFSTAAWTQVFTPSAVNLTIEASNWDFPARGMVAVAGKVYESTSLMTSFATTPIYDGSDQVNQIITRRNKDVWIVGNNSLISKERAFSGNFSDMIPPAGITNITAIAIADDGIIYIGADTKIFKSLDGATTAAGWEEVRDFGTNWAIHKINLVGRFVSLNGDGESQMLQVLANNSTAGNGMISISMDGGSIWEDFDTPNQVEATSAFFSLTNDNEAVLAGPVAATTPTLVRVQPKFVDAA